MDSCGFLLPLFSGASGCFSSLLVRRMGESSAGVHTHGGGDAVSVGRES